MFKKGSTQRTVVLHEPEAVVLRILNPKQLLESDRAESEVERAQCSIPYEVFRLPERVVAPVEVVETESALPIHPHAFEETFSKGPRCLVFDVEDQFILGSHGQVH